MSDNNKLYVGNLPFSTSKDDLTKLFSEHGTVQDVHLVTDRDTGRSRGFAFVEMSDNSEAQKAIDALNGSKMGDRDLIVSVARPKQDRGPRPNRY
jgi:cold-inducible RNA-binding protein